jgi:DNA repair protein SbcD/Mre11
LSRPIRFVHAADLHLGARFKRLDVPEGPLAEMFRAATGAALENVVRICLENDVDLLIIAGDVYEERSPALADRARFQKAMQRLAEAGIPVYLARGNHDAADSSGTELELPSSVRVFSSADVERIPIERDGELVGAIYGTSYPSARENRNLASKFARTGNEPVAIGVLHTEVGSGGLGGDYSPSTAEDLRAAGMDYWALGHIHKPDVVLDGIPAATYSGSPQGLTPNETGSHGCRVVELTPGSCAAPLVTCSAFAWERLEVDISGCAGIDDVRAAVVRAVTGAAAAEPGRGLAVRVTLVGSSEAHGALAREGAAAMTELLREDLEAVRELVWLDRLADRSTRRLDSTALAADASLPGDIVRVVEGLTKDPPAAATMVGETVGQILRTVPGLSDEDRRAFDATDLLLRARDVALDRLLPDGEL